jgi:hypothetical protein
MYYIIYYSKVCGRVGWNLSPEDLTVKYLSLKYDLKNLKRKVKIPTVWMVLSSLRIPMY